MFRTTAAYLSGAICGNLWWPTGALAGKPVQINCRGPWGFMDRFNEPASFEEALHALLVRDGGDFQNAMFTADSEIRVERREVTGPGKYRIHARTIPVAKLAPDLVNQDAFSGDFFED